MRKLIFIIIVLTSRLFGQTDSLKTFALGLQTTLSSQFAEYFGSGLVLSYQNNRHQFNGSFDIHSISFYSKSQNIPGGQLGYSYLLRHPKRTFNFLLNCNFQYVQYAQGIGWAVRYNYLPTDPTYKEINLFRTRSFSQTLGVGFHFLIAKSVRPYFIFNGGYCYFKRTLSPTNESGYIREPREGISLALQFKLGLTIDLYSKKPHSS